MTQVAHLRLALTRVIQEYGRRVTFSGLLFTGDLGASHGDVAAWPINEELFAPLRQQQNAGKVILVFQVLDRLTRDPAHIDVAMNSGVDIVFAHTPRDLFRKVIEHENARELLCVEGVESERLYTALSQLVAADPMGTNAILPIPMV